MSQICGHPIEQRQAALEFLQTVVMRVRSKPKKEKPVVQSRRQSLALLAGQSDYFEYRWVSVEDVSYQTSQCELFNKFTGEAIVKDENNDPSYPDTINRSYSLWKERELQAAYQTEEVADDYAIQVLFPQPYSSRMWGSRNFHVPIGIDSDSALITIQAGVRGFLARRLLRALHKYWYYKRLCPDSGYYYFEDCKNQNISWHKPRLARIQDILAPPEDVLSIAAAECNQLALNGTNGKDEIQEHLSNRNILYGPFYQISDKGNGAKRRSDQAIGVFLEENDWRAQALRTLDEIDLEKTPLWETIAWYVRTRLYIVRALSVALHMYITLQM